jgi:hypothetical protein
MNHKRNDSDKNNNIDIIATDKNEKVNVFTFLDINVWINCRAWLIQLFHQQKKVSPKKSSFPSLKKVSAVSSMTADSNSTRNFFLSFQSLFDDPHVLVQTAVASTTTAGNRHVTHNVEQAALPVIPHNINNNNITFNNIYNFDVLMIGIMEQCCHDILYTST